MKRTLEEIDADLKIARQRVDNLHKEQQFHPETLRQEEERRKAQKHVSLLSQLTNVSTDLPPWLSEEMTGIGHKGHRLILLESMFQLGKHHVKDGIYLDCLSIRVQFEGDERAKLYEVDLMGSDPRDLGGLRLPLGNPWNYQFTSEQKMFLAFFVLNGDSRSKTMAALLLAAWLATDDPQDNDCTIEAAWREIWSGNKTAPI
jgi:hypothetical protein